MKALQGKTVFITGATRGIGREIALRCAADGANIVIAGKTVTPHPKLPGTIYTVAEEVIAAGGKALPLELDVRSGKAIYSAVTKIIKTFGGMDILVNNASVLNLTKTLETPLKRFDLMMNVNVRAVFACSQACLPWLIKSDNPHILNMSPPLHLKSRWFAPHLAYTMSKYGMSVCTLGLSEEFKSEGVAVNSLWPKTLISTAAILFNFPKEIFLASRKPAIVADAAYWILTQPSKKTTGNFFIDEDILRANGLNDFSAYAMDAQKELFMDLFIE